MRSVAICYATGTGVPRDTVKAAEWNRKAVALRAFNSLEMSWRANPNFGTVGT
jgi:hypothetical protein